MQDQRAPPRISDAELVTVAIAQVLLGPANDRQLPALARYRRSRLFSHGCVERLQLTILEECWRPSFVRSRVPKITALRRDLYEYLHDYNLDRAHTGPLIKGRLPADIVHGSR